VFTAFLNKTLSQKRFNLILYTGDPTGIDRIIYLSASLYSFFTLLLHFMDKTDVIKQFYCYIPFIYGVYFLLNFNLISCISRPDARAGMAMSIKKIKVFIKGVLLRSIHYNVILRPSSFDNYSNHLIGIDIFFIYGRTKTKHKRINWFFFCWHICRILFSSDSLAISHVRNKANTYSFIGEFNRVFTPK